MAARFLILCATVLFAVCTLPARPVGAGALVTERVPAAPAHARPGLDGVCAFSPQPHCADVGIARIVASEAAYIEWLCLDRPGLRRCDMVLRRYGGGRFGAALERALRAHLQAVCARSGERPGCVGRGPTEG